MKKTIRILLPIYSLLMIGIIGFVGLDAGIGVVEAQTFGSNWTAEYFNNTNLSGSPVVAVIDPVINYNWATGSPNVLVNRDNFSVRWTGLENFDVPGTYRFTASADDGVRVTINGNVVIDDFVQTNGLSVRIADVELPAGTSEIIVEYVEFGGTAAIQFFWEPFNVGTEGPTATPPNTALPPIPAGALRATVIRASVLNVRDAPSLGGNVIGRILRGETYQVTGRNEDATWFVLQLAGFEGWVYGYYLFIDGNEFNPPIRSATSVFGVPPNFNDTGVLVQTKATMRMRATPSVFARQTGRITWGSIIPVSARTPAGDWYQVLWKGTIGWVFTGFLDVTQGDLDNVPIVNP